MKVSEALNFSDAEIFSGGRLNDDTFDLEDESRVYFLLDKNEVVYVGQTINLGTRKAQHKRDKDFDNISFICVNKEIVNDVEAAYIVRFKPKHNNNLPYNNEYISLSNVRSDCVSIVEDAVVNASNRRAIAYESKKAKYIKASDRDLIVGSIAEAINAAIKSMIEGDQ